MNPGLSIDDLNALAKHRIAQRNDLPLPDFCGLTPNLMNNWLYAPLSALQGVTIKVPADLSTSPVMRYLGLILDEIVQQGGSLKATTKGNLPLRIVKQASALLPEFPAAQFDADRQFSDYQGNNEDKFIALHYARLLAEIAEIIRLERGQFLLGKNVQKTYQQHGIGGLYLRMLDAAVKGYNWGYQDGWEGGEDLHIFWLFMLWRLQKHGSASRLADELSVAMPGFVDQLPSGYQYADRNEPRKWMLSELIQLRFITRFLQFWGFVAVDPRRYKDGNPIPMKLEILPLLGQSFQFSVQA